MQIAIDNKHAVASPKILGQAVRENVLCGVGGLEKTQTPFFESNIGKHTRSSLEDQLREQAITLKVLEDRDTRVRKDVREFLGAITHDLKAPIRILLAFSGYLQDEFGSQLSETATEYVKNMDASANDLKALVGGLSTLTRESTRDLDRVRTPLNRIVDEAISELQEYILLLGAVVEVGPLPEIPCDPNQMRTLFKCLIENGIKFNESDVPSVVIRASRTGAECIIAIRDNGIGILPKFHGAVFEIFRQLRRSSRIEGVGIGLTLCRSIVEQHGGRIWVESKGNEGSIFSVCLAD